MDYFGEQATTVSSQGERRSRRKSRNKLRAYLYGSSSHESSQSLSSDEEDERRNSLADAARGAKKRLSRTGSSIMQLSTAKGSSSYLTSASTPNLLPSDTEESTTIAEQIKERARLDRIAAQNHVSSPVDQDKHVDSVMAPLRRKSLYTPGLATRQSSDILRKPPPPHSIQSQADRDYYYNPAYPATSPLAQLAALNHGNNGRDTPTQDVTHLGGLQLGSLRVTNGAASPIPPSTASSRSHQRNASDFNSPDDFQTASEGSDADEGLILVTPQPRNLATESSPTNQAIANLQEDGQEPYSKRSSFPFQATPSDHASRMANEYASELNGSPFTNSETLPQDESTISEDRPFSYSETPLSIQTATHATRVGGIGMAVSSSQDSQMQSWRPMTEDEEVEAISTGRGTRQDAFSKLNGSSTSSIYTFPAEHAVTIDNAHSSKASLITGQQGFLAAPIIDSGYSSRASLSTGQHRTTADSVSQESRPQLTPSRSSLVSSLREVPPVRSNGDAAYLVPSAPPQVRPSFTVIPQYAITRAEPSVTSTGALQTISSARASARASSQTLVRKLQKARPKSQPPPPVNTITVQGSRDLEQVHIPRVPSLIAAKHAERLDQFPVLDHTFPSSDHVNVSRTSTLSHPYNVPIRFPSPANALESAAAGYGYTNAPLYPEPTIMIPPQSNDRVTDEDDERGSSNIVKSPSWSAFGGNKQKKLQKKAIKERKETEKRQAKEERELEKKFLQERKDVEKQKRRSDSKERSSRSRRASWYRGRSSERPSSERDVQATISDFGTVAESLGNSPYDIARSMQPANHAFPQTNWHPHQISTATPRPKSLVRMSTDVGAGSSYARGRPRSQSIGRPMSPVSEGSGVDDGIRGRKIYARPQTMYADVPPVPAIPAVDLRQRDREWAQSRQRSRSVSKAQEDYRQSGAYDFSNDAPNLAGRPQSMFVDAPPLPTLPRSDQLNELRGEMKRSHPHLPSMSAESPVSPVSHFHSQDIELAAEPSAASQRSREMLTSGMVSPPVLRDGKQQAEERVKSCAQSTNVGSQPSPISRPQSLLRDVSAEQSDSSQSSSGSFEHAGHAPLRAARTTQMAVPDLWTSGSLERKNPKEVSLLEQSTQLGASAVQDASQDPNEHMWTAQQQAWSERRKSAGEALLSKSQQRDIYDFENPVAGSPPVQMPRPESTMTAPAADSHSVLVKKTRRPASSPLALSTADVAPLRSTGQSPNEKSAPEPYVDQARTFPTPAERRREQAKTNSIPRKRIGSGTSTPRATSQHRNSGLLPNSSRPVSASIDADVPPTSSHLMQRYGGGLLYNYEPGQGLGGSAGTRGGSTLASRKSVELSKGYGIDLSDVPVFIVPAMR